MSTHEYMTTKELAALIRKTPGAVRTMRRRGQGPHGIRVGADTLYHRDDVNAWLTTRNAA